MSKDEIEREAGGAIFTSNNEETRNQVENTRYRGSGQTTSSRVASGATETRLTDGDRQQGGIGPGMESSNDQLYGANSGYRSSYDYEKTFQSGSSSSSQAGSGSIASSQDRSGSISGSSSRGAIAQSEWKLLDNGTYIKVYHSKSTAGGAGSAQGGRNRYNSGSSDTGWVVQPDGSRRRQQGSWSSSSTSSTSYGGGVTQHGGRGGSINGNFGKAGEGNNYDSGSSDSGWVTMPDGSRRREQSEWSSSSSVTSSGNTNLGYGSTSRGTNRVSPSASETRLSSSSRNRNENTNTIFNAARGPGDYHGTMSKNELENNAGGQIFGSTNTETRNQVENTRYQGGSFSNNNAEQGGGATYQEGSYYDQENRARYNSGGRSRTGQSTASSSGEGVSSGGQSLFGSGYSKSSSSSSSSGSGSSRSSPPKGQWVWDQTADGGKGKWEWSTTTSIEENTSSVTQSSGSQRGGYSSSDGSYSASSSGGNLNYNNRGYVIQPNGTIQNSRSTSYREESSYGGVRLNSEDEDEISKHFAHGEILDHNRIGGNGVGHETGDIGKDSTGK